MMQIYTFLRFITRITLKIISDAIKTVRFLNEDLKKISIMDDSQEKYSLPLQKNKYLRQEYQNRQIHVFLLPLNNFLPFYQFLI